MEQMRCLWPHEAAQQLRICPSNNPLKRAILLSRCGNEQHAEAVLLGSLQTPSCAQRALALDLLAGVQQRRRQSHRAAQLLQQAEELIHNQARNGGRQELQSIQTSLQLRRRQLTALEALNNDPPDCTRHSPLQWLQALQEAIRRADWPTLQRCLENWPEDVNSPEGLELKSVALRQLGRNGEAMQVIDQLLRRGGHSSLAWRHLLLMNIGSQRANGLAMATATRQFPRDAEIAHLRNALQILARQTAAGRRSAFQERLEHSLGAANTHPGESDGNLLNAYDQTGCSHLLPWLHPEARAALAERPLLCSNLVMQLASQTHPLAVDACLELAQRFPNPETIEPNRDPGSPLRVGLVSPDFGYHPVGRFVQMLMEAGLGRQGELWLIATQGSVLARTRELAQNRLIDLNGQSEADQLSTVRTLKLDVAVDLTGWTANHHAHLFGPRIAPVQVNYLGYYASSGLKAMDVWLGDATLFPTPMQEWHSERIVRLNRPFLAWKPSEHLKEGTVALPGSPTGPMVFGCFNHVRKLSSATLSLWADILNANPGSRLALKAYTSDDPGVTKLLERRMQRCGLQPSAVIWLPTSAKPEDHLRQYGLIDVALDPFPNGGCTTTCEALWMGVPVITLLGSHYVGRMSAAVLKGAGMGRWIANDHDHYLKLACEAARAVEDLRQQRASLRAQLQSSALGDAAGLARELWSCWADLAQRRA